MQPFSETGRDPAAPRGAVCSAHPQMAATSTCTRCGDFLCETCRTEGESVCASCRSRVGGGAFPFDRSKLDLGQVVSYCWSRFKDEWLVLLGAGTAVIVVPYAVQILQVIVSAMLMAMGADSSSPWMLQVVMLAFYFPQIVLQMALMLGGFRVAIDVLEGRPPSFAAYFDAMKRCLAAFAQVLLIYLVLLVAAVPLFGLGYLVHQTFGEVGVAAYVGLVMVALAFPGVYVALGLAYMSLELTYDRTVGPIEAIRRSWQIAKGRRLDIFVLILVQFGSMVLGFFMCCVGMLPAMGFFFLVQAAGFLGLRRGLLAAPPPDPSRF